MKPRFCVRCVMSDRRPVSTPEHEHAPTRVHTGLAIDPWGVCTACRIADAKRDTVWGARHDRLLRLLDRHRGKHGTYDCIVPGSGGKDSCFAADVLKREFGMSPLTATWPPFLYTGVGLRNFERWRALFPNVAAPRDPEVHALLTRAAIENLFHPFQTFILGQKNFAPKLAAETGVPLVFYGESEAEYGNPPGEWGDEHRHLRYFSWPERQSCLIAGVPAPEWEGRGVPPEALEPYLPAKPETLVAAKVDVQYLGHYLRWIPQEAYYAAVEHCGFEANPERTEGTYSKYNSLDDKIDGLHYWTAWVKFGLGRASHDAAQEIRNGHLTREEGVALVRRFDGEFPVKYFKEIMAAVGMAEDAFMDLADRWRPDDLWEKREGAWELRHPVWAA